MQKEGGKQRIPVKIQIAEQQYSKAEVKEMFERVIRRMDTLILGENKSFDRVEQNLNLLAKVPDEPVEVTWELDRYDADEYQRRDSEAKTTRNRNSGEYQCSADVYRR